MSIQFDDKGKFFTDYITKNVVLAKIQTCTHLIRGEIYIRVGERISDELNASARFLAITNASVCDLNGALVYTSEFMTINRDHIVWLIPDEQDNESGEGNGGGS